MKILFVESPAPWLVRQHAQVPLGLLYLATVVKNAGYEVTFIRPKDKLELAEYENYDVFCFSGTTLEFPMICDCAKFVRKNFPNIKILLGGTHATVMYKEIWEMKLFDAVCVGEGEEMILKMLKDVRDKKLKSIYMSSFIKDLDSLPFPDRDLIPGKHGGGIFINGGTENENIITSRGCPFDCAFCASESIWHRKVRFRSTENIIAEMKQIIDKYGCKTFRVADDNVTSHKTRCLDLCRELEKLDIKWRCSIRAESIDREVAEALVRAGCQEISPGIESGDQRVLDFLRKRTTLGKMLVGCENAVKAGLRVRALMMIGTPGEREDTPEKNKAYLQILPYHMVTLSTFVPLPGNAIWKNPAKFKCSIINKNFAHYNKDYYISKHGEQVKRDYVPLIRNWMLTLNQQVDNVKRMEKYIEELGKVNKG